MPRNTLKNESIHKIGMIGNYLPRKCGIATFTRDLSDAIVTEYPKTDCFVAAMNDAFHEYDYPARVRLEIREGDLTDYRAAADFLNVNHVDVVSLQHEYGIFGGKAGGHILALLRELRIPVVTTLHTVLQEPDQVQRKVMDEIAKRSERLIVMTERGAEFLKRIYEVDSAKIDLIPHGIPDLKADPAYKKHLGMTDKQVILTFGLLSPDKGIEYVIDALPAIRERHPNVVYMVVGTTHPNIKARDGEAYRGMLEERARKLGVGANVIFYNRFVTQSELAEFLGASDVYVTPYTKMEQITSGTLSYAVGGGKAVVSTPYWHAEELLADGRGILVPPRDGAAIAKEVLGLLGDNKRRLAMADKARAYGRRMLWSTVARSYMRSFEQAQDKHRARVQVALYTKTLAERPSELPELNLEHLELMTDGTGLLQHSLYATPRYEDGYCIDDNARAFRLMMLLDDSGLIDRATVRALGSRYLAFLHHAFRRESARFHNFMSYDRQWLDDVGSEDSHGRTLWALGTAVHRSSNKPFKNLSTDLFREAMRPVQGFTSARAWAFTLLGIDEYMRVYGEDVRATRLRKMLVERLVQCFDASQAPGWMWFENNLTYDNAHLAHALIVSGHAMHDANVADKGIHALKWLTDIQRSEEGFFAPIGSKGFYTRGGNRAYFDQQPLEACAMVTACIDTWRITSDREWISHARRAFDWYLGQNQVRLSLYDPSTGGSRDGLGENFVNENQGAESTLSFLLSLLEMRILDGAWEGNI